MAEESFIVGIGEVLFDVFPKGRKVGGAPANFAYIVSQFGFPSLAISAIGQDTLGKELLELFDKKQLRYEISEVNLPTGTVDVTLNAQGVPTYDIKRNVAWENIPFNSLLEKIAQKTRVVSFGSLAQRGEVSKKTILKFLECMPNEPDTFKMFDINLRQNFYTKEIIETSLKLCNVLKINDEELEIVADLLNFSDKNQEESCRYLFQKYALKLLILTCGEKGSFIFTQDETSFLDTPKVNIVDTVGAGDSFGASFMASLLKGKTIQEAHKTAVQISAYICTQSGAMAELPPEYLS